MQESLAEMKTKKDLYEAAALAQTSTQELLQGDDSIIYQI